MSKPGRGRTVAGALGALAAGLLIAAGPAAADPIESAGPAPSLPAYQGAPATAQKIKDPTIAPQNPFMAENPNSNIHNDTWMTDAYQRKGPLGKSPVATSEAKPLRICGSLAFDSSGRIVSVCPSLFAGPQIRIMDPDTPGDPRLAGPARRGEPARHEAVPELHRRRLLLPRPEGPHLGADEDRPHPGLQRGRRRRHADAGARLRPDLGARRVDRADQLGAAGLQRPDLVRLEGERQGRDAGPEDRRAQGQDHERGDRELVRGRQGRRLHRLRQAHVPVQGEQERRAEGGLEEDATRTRGSSSRARSTPARARRRRSWTTATSRSPTTPTR